MINNNNHDDDETNIEFYASRNAAEYPYNDPDALKLIHDHTWQIILINMKSRAERQAQRRRDADQIDREERDGDN
jgi:hypothetical protein